MVNTQIERDSMGEVNTPANAQKNLELGLLSEDVATAICTAVTNYSNLRWINSDPLTRLGDHGI